MGVERRERTMGVYAITSPSGKQYIGSTADIDLRWRQHRRRLDRGVHHARALQAAWRKYGAESFTFSVLEVVEDRVVLLEREQAWLDRRSEATGGRGYNGQPNATRSGKKQEATPALRAYWASMRGRPATGAAAEALARGRSVVAKWTPEQRGAKLAEGHRRGKQARGGDTTEGQKRTAEFHRGRPKSAGTRAKLAAANLGRKQPPEVVAKRAATLEAMGHTDRMRTIWTGRKHSKETRAKMSAAHRARLAARQAVDACAAPVQQPPLFP